MTGEYSKLRGLDNLEVLCTFLTNRSECVYKNPSNEFQKFINAFVFLNSNLRRQDAVKKGQELWRSRPDGLQPETVPLKFDLIFQQAIEKMKKIQSNR